MTGGVGSILCWYVTLLSCIHNVPQVVGVDRNQNLDKSSWYSRYEHYPPYCSIPDELSSRRIPPLPAKSKAGESRLLQVTAVVRHGSRTPTWDDHPDICWPGYESIWNCDLTSWIVTPPGDDPGMFWMNKEYTALHDPQENLTNVLGGTCQKGQLLMQGYDQEVQNGRFFRDAYVYQGDNDYGHDIRLRLLNAKALFQNHTALKSQIYYRSDDDQRTVMSGQLLLRAMLQEELNQFHNRKKAEVRYPILPLHVADRERDILEPNSAFCPRLQEIEESYKHSPQYQDFWNSNERKLLEDFIEKQLGGGKPTLDCLMTTICTDRTLPDAINDYEGESMEAQDYYKAFFNKRFPVATKTTLDGGKVDQDYGTNLFRRLALLDIIPYEILLTVNNGEFSKLAMGPLWKEILHHITAAVDPGDVGDVDPPPARFALFSGHDTTILPLLASLGVWNSSSDFWPAYASSFIIEVHELNFDGTTDATLFPTNFAFRLLYNGQVFTSRIPSCPQEPEHLCSLDVLLNLAEPLVQRNCNLKYPASNKNNPTAGATQIASLVQSEPKVTNMMMILASFIGGFVFAVACNSFCYKVFSSCCSKQSPNGKFTSISNEEPNGMVGLEHSSYRDHPEHHPSSELQNHWERTIS